ncbi:MAG: TlpA disulfide reductase family protein [Stappiaceae bacterium]
MGFTTDIHTNLSHTQTGLETGRIEFAEAATSDGHQTGAHQDHHHDHSDHHAHDSDTDHSVEKIERVSELDDWSVEGINEASGSFKDLLSQGTIVHFWASWCGPCEEEFPELAAFYQQHVAENENLKLVTISNDQVALLADRFIKKHRTTFPVYLDPEQKSNLALVGQRALPSTVMIDADGRIHRLALGKLDWTFNKLPEVLASIAGKQSEHDGHAKITEDKAH